MHDPQGVDPRLRRLCSRVTLQVHHITFGSVRLRSKLMPRESEALSEERQHYQFRD